MALNRENFVHEIVSQSRQGDGLLVFEYRVWESQARRNAGDRPVILNNHRAMIRETHQRVKTDAQGRLLHQSGAAVAPEDLEAFLEDPPPGGPYDPYIFPNYWGVDEELDGQWQRETFTVPIEDQVAEAIGRFLNRANRVAVKRFGSEGLVRGTTRDFRGTTLNLTVGASADDAFQASTDVVTITGTSHLNDSTTEHTGFRFQNVTIANAATIDDAIFTPFISGSTGDEPLHILKGQDADDAAEFAAVDNDIDGRTRTTASNSWNVSDLAVPSSGHVEWGSAASDPTNGTTIETIIQEIVDRAGWASGNDIVLIFEQSSLDATRDLQITMYDNNSSNAAKLDIDFTGGATTHQINAALSGTGTLAATVTVRIPITAALSGTGTLAATVNLIIPVASALAGTGTLSGTVNLIVPVVASLSGAGTLTGDVSLIIPIEAALSGTGTLSATVEVLNITAALSGSGTLSATVTLVIPIEAALSGSGTLSADVSLIIPIAAALSGTGTLTAALDAFKPIEAALSGTGTLSASVDLIIPIEAALSGSGVLTADVSLIIPIAAALTGTGDLSADLNVIGLVDIAAELSGTGTLSADVTVVSPQAPQPDVPAAGTGGGLSPGGRYPTLINILDYYLPVPPAVRPLPISATLPAIRATLAVPLVEMAEQRSAWSVVAAGNMREPQFSGWHKETRAGIHAVAVGTAQAAVPGVMDWRAYDLHTRQLARYADQDAEIARRADAKTATRVWLLEWQHAEDRTAWERETQRQVRETEEALAVLLL